MITGLQCGKAARVERRISIICFGVKDLESSVRFWRDEFGLPTTREASAGVVFFQTSGACFELSPYEELANGVAGDFTVECSKFPGFTLAHNGRSAGRVADVLRTTKQAGARIEKPAQCTSSDGYSRYFSDPAGYL